MKIDNLAIFKKIKKLLLEWKQADLILIYKELNSIDNNSLEQGYLKQLLNNDYLKTDFLNTVSKINSFDKIQEWPKAGLEFIALDLKDSVLVIMGSEANSVKLKQVLEYSGLTAEKADELLKNESLMESKDLVYVQGLLKILTEEIEIWSENASEYEADLNQANLKNSKSYLSEELIGKSDSMNFIYGILNKIKDIKASVLISGDEGVGKSLAAKTLHKISERKDQIFEEETCTELNGNYLEESLFGELKKGKLIPGKIEKADQGTLVIKNIEYLPKALHSKLSRFISEGSFLPKNSENPAKADVRLIFTTQLKPEQLMEKNLLNQELFYKINVINIKIPKLMNRSEDIVDLANYFIKTNSRTDKKLAPDVLEIFYNYSWPKNVAELRQEILRLLQLQPKNESVISNKNISTKVKNSSSYLATSAFEGKNLKEAFVILEKRMLEESLSKLRWNQSQVAKNLGISRTSVINKIKTYQLAKDLKKSS